VHGGQTWGYGGRLKCRMGWRIGCHGYCCYWAVCDGRMRAIRAQLDGAASNFKIHLNAEIMAKQTEKGISGFYTSGCK
jgi:hypothetical protein